jgi:PIN domain nuclease of toxin-antitoxin system
MHYLLDTHVLLWLLTDEQTIPAATRQMLADPANSLAVSVVSIWEIAIKRRLGKLTLSQPTQAIIDELTRLDITLIPMLSQHVLLVEQLPLHHSDPFDRLIIAQAMVENQIIVSRDRYFATYPVSVRWD